MKLFELRRDEDESGISGIGTVAQGVIFDNGWCAIAWLTEHTSVAFYTDIGEVVAIHGHSGKTRVVQVAHYNAEMVRDLATNAYQDECENFGAGFGDRGAASYLWNQRQQLLTLFDAQELK